MHNLLYIGIIKIPQKYITDHKHSVWEIVYYTHGTGTLKIGNEEFKFKPKDIVCQPPGTIHSEHSNSGFRNIHFSVETFGNVVENVLFYRDSINDVFYNMLIQLHREYHRKGKNWINITEALLNTINQYLIAWRLEKKYSYPFVENLENILISNISNGDFQLKEALNDIPISNDHIRKLFKKVTGKSPIKFINDMRIEYSKQLLKDIHGSFYTVKEVANRVGFSDPYYFSRAFTKSTGKNPSQWRKERSNPTSYTTIQP